ncbi:NmrA family transcriptional regulator [Labrys miyagiensis]|uniref:NmrA family transcriptional regulator n=1 Tax=Labrys miyagiensis TaxID=346912 RepID=A0ABQ6CTI2_9HYPH|nr:NmrA family NAD(P)-binding protein [Labrys miyagiensis]GLS23657.1 NmrA family transcriptional regulator [Labrys miyagiensis]
MANNPYGNGSILVLGGTGKTGRLVAEGLVKAGRDVRIGSRHAEPHFDWERPESWGAALADMSAVYVAYQPDIAVPGAVETIRAFFRQAIAAGIAKIVLLSGRGEAEAEEAEAVLQDLAIDWTILRCSWFFQNFSEAFLLDDIRAGEVALPAGLAPEPFVDTRDIAQIAVAAFNDPRHARQRYEITGPRALTFAEAIAAIAAATGRPIAYASVPVEAYRAELQRMQMPAPYVDLVLYLFTTVLDGRNTPLADGVRRALGRPPRDFAAYVADVAATGIWGGNHA